MNKNNFKFYFNFKSEGSITSKSTSYKNKIVRVTTYLLSKIITAYVEIEGIKYSASVTCSVNDTYNGRYGRVLATVKLIKVLKAESHFTIAKEIEEIVSKNSKNYPYLYLFVKDIYDKAKVNYISYVKEFTNKY